VGRGGCERVGIEESLREMGMGIFLFSFVVFGGLEVRFGEEKYHNLDIFRAMP